MPDISVTRQNVGLSTESGATVKVVQYEEAINQGQSVYLNATTGKYKLADANASVLTAEAKGIAITAGGIDDYGVIVTDGDMDPGATLVIGTVYVVSATPGGIAPAADITTGWWTTILGVAISTSRLHVDINASGAQA